MKKIYLDYASTTPLDPVVKKAMEPYFDLKFGNPGSLHFFGQEALAAIDNSRETVAGLIGAKFNEIIFTGGATEANNLALRGCVSGVMRQVSGVQKPRIVVSAIEHESVLETARDLEKWGVEVVYIPVDQKGVVNLDKIQENLNENTALVSIMYANNEIGTIQPLKEISDIIGEFKKSITNRPLFHVDAVQAFQYLDCDVNKLGVDFMTLSAHKIYGPKGVGALYVRSANSKLETLNSKFPLKLVKPILTGGGQEFGLRSGTENVPPIVGFAKAAEIAVKQREKEAVRIAKLRDYLWGGIKKIYPKAEVNGSSDTNTQMHPNVQMRHSSHSRGISNWSRLPNNLNVYLPGHESQYFLTQLDLAGVAASSGSACRARSLTPSYVIEALGHSRERAKQSVRFTLGRPTTRADIDKTLKVLYSF